MKRRSKFMLVGVLAIVLALAVAVPAFAETDDSAAVGPGTGYCEYGYGDCGAMLGAGVRGLDAAAEILGMDVDDLIAMRHDGQSLAEIAQSKGMSTETLVAEMLKAREEALDAAVAAGTITQDQADYMMEHMSETLADRVNDTDMGPGAGAGGFGGRGMRGGCGMDWES